MKPCFKDFPAHELGNDFCIVSAKHFLLDNWVRLFHFLMELRFSDSKFERHSGISA
jgi:hypothetical protein